jgi:MarR family transcriptional regulator for hemolysin
MLTDIITKFLTSNTTTYSTYKTGLLQAKAYRALKQRTAELLKPFDLSTMEWVVLGSLSEMHDGLTHTQIAELVGVETPFATNLVTALEEKKLVKRKLNPKDKRYKIVMLVPSARSTVATIEKQLRAEMKPLLKGYSLTDIVGYMNVLKTIISNNDLLNKAK